MQILSKTTFALATIAAAMPATAQTASAFLIDHVNTGDRLARIDMETFQVDVVGQLDGPSVFFTGLAFGQDGGLYAYELNANNFAPLGLNAVDLETGDSTLIGGGGLFPGDRVHDLEWNPVDGEIYGVGSSNNGVIRLYTFDLSSGMATEVQQINDTSTFGMALAIGLAIDPSGRIFVFNHLFEDQMYEVVAGALQPLPQPVPFDASFSQGMTYDQNANVWYLAGYEWMTQTAVFYTIDPATGTGPLLASIPGREFGDIAILEYAKFPLGQSYCVANPNSTGLPASIGAFGSGVAAEDLVRLVASELPANRFGYFLNSPTQGFVQNPGGSQGNLCLGGAIGRHVADVASSGASGELSLDLDLSALPRPNGHATVMAGETWNFTAWFRDMNPTPTSNFTDGVSLTFL